MSSTILTLKHGKGVYAVGLCEEGIAYGPSRLALDDLLNIYLLDGLNSRIQKFTSQGKFVRSINDKKIRTAVDMFVAPNGIIYILDEAHQRITIYNQKGGQIESFHYAKMPSEPLFDRIRVSKTGEILIGHILRLYKVIRENSFGTRSKPYRLDLVSDLYEYRTEKVSQEPRGTLLGTDRKGNTYFVVWAPDPQKSDSHQRVIRKYSPEDELLATVGELRPGYFSYGVGERDLAVDKKGNIYHLYSTKNGTVQIIIWSER